MVLSPRRGLHSVGGSISGTIGNTFNLDKRLLFGQCWPFARVGVVRVTDLHAQLLAVHPVEHAAQRYVEWCLYACVYDMQ